MVRPPLLALLPLLACAAPPPASVSFRAMTFNGGTTPGLDHDAPPDDGYSSDMAAVADELYENSLSWNPAEAALTAFLARERPDLVVFQEIFHDPWCRDIEADPDLDFVCRDWSEDRPAQPQRLLGPDYQVVCAPGQPDNCAGVRLEFGRFRDCGEELCPEGLAGRAPPSGCSRGARVGSAVVELEAGGELVLVDVHGTSGVEEEDEACRVEQFEQVFVDAGDGRPAARGERNLVMGDLNTDPGLLAGSDPSAARWNDFVGEDKPFRWISDPDPRSPASYGGLLRIDHVVSDAATGTCRLAGISPDLRAVMQAVYWDHVPVLCDVELPASPALGND